MLPTKQLAERLADARRRAGLTQAQLAERVGFGRTTLVAVEKGERRPSDQELVRFAAALEVELHDLVREHASKASASPRFRMAPASRVGRVAAAEQARTVQRLEDFGRWYRDLEAGAEVGRPRGSLAQLDTYRVVGDGGRGSEGEGSLDPASEGEDAADAVRRILGLGDRPALHVREQLEREAGLAVFYLDDMPSGIAGILLWGEELGACVGINARMPRGRRRWSVAHELGHFLRDPERGDVLPDGPMARRDASEVFCDAFAAAFLMPASGVRREFKQRVRAGGGTFPVAELVRVADHYQVSFEAMTRRLQDLALIPGGTLRTLRRRSFQPDRARDALRLDGGREMPHLERFPRRYVTLAFRAFEEERIGEGDLARLLACDRVTARRIYLDARSTTLDDDERLDLDVSEDVLEAK